MEQKLETAKQACLESTSSQKKIVRSEKCKKKKKKIAWIVSTSSAPDTFRTLLGPDHAVENHWFIPSHPFLALRQFT